MIDQPAAGEIHGDHVAGGALTIQPHGLRLQRVDLAGGNGITEENPRIGLCNDGVGSGGAESNGGVLAGGAAAEVGAGDDDGVVGGRGVRGDEGGGVEGGREPD